MFAPQQGNISNKCYCHNLCEMHFYQLELEIISIFYFAKLRKRGQKDKEETETGGEE